MRDRRAEVVLQIHQLACRAFARHEIRTLTENRLVCARPDRSDYGFEVALLGWGRIIVHGSISPVIFRGGDGGPLLERLAWLASGDAWYVREHADHPTPQGYWEYDPEALADEIEERVERERADAIPDYDPREFTADPEDDEPLPPGGDAAPYPAALAPDLSQELRTRHALALSLARRLRNSEVEERDAYRELYEMGAEAGSRSGQVYAPDLLWAHEAARAAFRLLHVDRALVDFLDAPSTRGLAVYNAIVRAHRGVDPRVLRAAETEVKRDVARIKKRGAGAQTSGWFEGE